MSDSLNANQPFISLIMMLNNHEPFNISPKEYYDKDFLKRRAKKYGIDSEVVDNFDINVLASVFSFEDALRNFLNRYKNRPDYNNTIFIISGDHYSYRAAIDNPLGVYHVPFIIYSPLIAKHKTFGGVSTHIDVTPSIIALLQESYGLKFSREKHWLSAGFDTSSTFRCNTIAHLNAYSTDYPNFIYKNYLLSNSEVYRIEENFSLVPVENADTIKIVQNYFENYKALDSYVCNNDRIWSSN